MSAYDERPWLARYLDRPAHIAPDHPTILAAWEATVAARPDEPFVLWFDGMLTVGEVDRRAAALAAALRDRGFAGGDRLAIYTQNDPAFVVGLLAAWKAGGTGVVVNPMNRRRELAYILADSGARALLCLDELHDSVAREVVAGDDVDVSIVVTYSALDDQARNDGRIFRETRRRPAPDGVLVLAEIVDGVGPVADGAPALPAATPGPDDVATLVYTSGTTGVPKGAMCTHANMSFNSQAFREWMDLGPEDRVLGVAPLFHITGLVGHVGLCLLTGAPLVLAHRFHPGVVLDAIREHRPTFTIGAITVFIALTGVDGACREDWESFRAVYSGGAPIPPSVADAFEASTGRYIHNAYGLTETNSITHVVPLGSRAPVDPGSGALSIGVPVFDTAASIVDDDRHPVPPGEVGELVISGPQVVPGYWQKPEATERSIPGGALHTGDVAVMNEDGWFFLVDRKKDMINASGYKVWPREVEDVLYEHPAVREAAVVGIPDPYKGEDVKAFVSLRAGASVTPEELIAFAKERLAAYKYPRHVELIDELPKTATGKILRRELREEAR